MMSPAKVGARAVPSVKAVKMIKVAITTGFRPKVSDIGSETLARKRKSFVEATYREYERAQDKAYEVDGYW